MPPTPSGSRAALRRSISRPLRLTLLLLGLLALPHTGHGEMQHYIDEHGASVFVDDSYLSPAEQRDLQRKVRATEQALRQPEATPVEVHGNQVLVPVELSDGRNRIQLRLLLDTGASQTVFHRPRLARLHCRPLARGWARLADGQLIATERVRLESLRVGPHNLERPVLYVIDLQGEEIPFDGLLGMDFLRKYPYRIDFQRQLLLWQKAD